MEDMSSAETQSRADNQEKTGGATVQGVQLANANKMSDDMGSTERQRENRSAPLRRQ